MTTKLEFIKSACVVFNCTHSVVLRALTAGESAKATIHAKIKAAAEQACGATNEDWIQFASQCQPGSVGDKFLWSLTTGGELVL